MQEQFLLKDAFFLLKRADATYALLGIENAETPVHSDRCDLLASNVIGYSKAAVIGFCAFFECFVNGAGVDFALRTSSLPYQVSEMLKSGKDDKKTFMPLPKKIERYAKAINPQAPPLVLADPKQRPEPFRTYFKEVQEPRDSLVHHAPHKAPIWYSPEEWKARAELAARQSVSCAAAVWRAFYSNRGLPRYLSRLDFAELSNEAVERVKAESTSAAK